MSSEKVHAEMNGFLALLAPATLALAPVGPGFLPETPPDAMTAGLAEPAPVPPDWHPLQGDASPDYPRQWVVPMIQTPTENQVRIESRIVVRISPRPNPGRINLAAPAPPRDPPRFKENKMEDCIALNDIAGVQTGAGNRLLLHLRDSRLVSASLENSCTARDFYSGFYVERHEDGKLCVKRDTLQSRTGAQCQLRRMRQLVAVSD